MTCMRVVQWAVRARKLTVPAPGSRRSSSSTASDTVTASTVTWDRSRMSSGRGVDPMRKAAARRSAVIPASRSGAMSRKGSSRPAVPGHRPGRLLDQEAEGVGRRRVGLELEQPGEQPVALLEARELLVVVHLVGPGQELAGLELDQDGGDHQELGGHLQVERLPGRPARPGIRPRCRPDGMS